MENVTCDANHKKHKAKQIQRDGSDYQLRVCWALQDNFVFYSNKYNGEV